MKNSSTFKIIILMSLSVAFASISSVTDITINDIKDALPPGITFPPELQNASIPTIEDGLKFLKDKCIKESGSDAAYDQIMQGFEGLSSCATNIVNVSSLPEEIEAGKKNGSLDTVFNKYCDKRNKALECVENFTKSLDPCMTKEEQDQKIVFVNITKSLLEFICHENGNQIALFIAEEGPECFNAKSDAIQECAMKTFDKYSNETVPDVDNLPSLIIKEENCIDMDKLEHCVVKHLETCKESTPANLVEALFRFVRKETPCSKYKKWVPEPNPNSSQVSKFSVNILVGTWLMAMVAKLLM